MSIYLVLKFIHIFAAIIGVGFSSTFAVIMRSARTEPAHLPFALRLLQRLERISSLAFTTLIVTGLLLVATGNAFWTELWVALSIAISLVATGLGQAVARPNLRRLIALVDKGAEAAEMAPLVARARKVGGVLGLCSFTLIVLMIFKPTL